MNKVMDKDKLFLKEITLQEYKDFYFKNLEPDEKKVIQNLFSHFELDEAYEVVLDSTDNTLDLKFLKEKLGYVLDELFSINLQDSGIVVTAVHRNREGAVYIEIYSIHDFTYFTAKLTNPLG